jgi:hypothetical protein
MVPTTFEAPSGALAAAAFKIGFDWHVALEVAAAVAGAAGVHLFVWDRETAEFRLLASTTTGSPEPSLDGAVLDVTTGATHADGHYSRAGIWWRVPIRDGTQLIAVLHLEYREAGELAPGVAATIGHWSRIAAAQLVRRELWPYDLWRTDARRRSKGRRVV